MKEIKLTIDGKEIQLTDEQLKVLRTEIEGKRKKKNPFARARFGEKYYYISSFGRVHDTPDTNHSADIDAYDNVNYFRDEAFANQVVLHQLLYRKLSKYAYENECEDIAEWDGSNKHWAVRYDYGCSTFATYYQYAYGAQEVYFSSEEGAKHAIEEVVKPFIKEHPEFKW